MNKLWRRRLLFGRLHCPSVIISVAFFHLQPGINLASLATTLAQRSQKLIFAHCAVLFYTLYRRRSRDPHRLSGCSVGSGCPFLRNEHVRRPRPILLNTHFGTSSPYWHLAFDSNALQLTAIKGKTHLAVALDEMQAAKIRRLSGVTASLDLTILLSGQPIHLHLVGRRVNKLEWAGTASAYTDTEAVARDLVHGLSFCRTGGVRG